MSLRHKRLPVVTFAALAIGLGTAYGFQTNRWLASRELDGAAARLQTVPKDVGDWKGTDVEFEPADFARAGISGTVFRRYRNVRTGATVSVLIVCGRGGPISVHTPDVCYADAGFQALGEPARRTVGAGSEGQVAVWSMEFAKPDPTDPARLEVCWGWIREGPLETPTDARLSYGRFPALYKIYVVREFMPKSRAAKDNWCDQFIQRALPEIQSALAPPAGAG
jgi:EpsI family protein